jgi:hypothetical protein
VQLFIFPLIVGVYAADAQAEKRVAAGECIGVGSGIPEWRKDQA